MDELIYKFLIQSGYPRSSIVSNLSNGLIKVKEGTKVGANGAAMDDSIAFVVVDPDTADYLAVVAVVGAVDKIGLESSAAGCAGYAANLDEYTLQCFVIRVDLDAHQSDEQVQFYRVRQDRQLLPLSVQSFPDIDSLRVSRKLRQKALPPAVEVIDSDYDSIEAGDKMPLSMYLPGAVLLLVAVANWLVTKFTGTGLLDANTVNLLIGSAFLLTIPASLRYYRG